EDHQIEKDMESSFNYLNHHFFVFAIGMIIIFGFQFYYGFPVGDTVDMSNFTFQLANYKDGGNAYGIFTAMFIHAGFDHIILNLIFLYPFTLITSLIIRDEIYFSVVLFTGLLAGIFSYFLNELPSLGASGWIFGIFGFLTPYYLYNRAYLGSNVQDIPWVFLFVAVYTVLQGISDPYIDNVAHIIGFLSGIGYGFIYFKYYYSSKQKILSN
ncbi:rhomboid family intramembrane serine protease, partial [Candidatus Gracilibacteria bacterium]|nr:rhomboid family intramembrane serine protease [Candidatus Gracilibacteria bacterium]